MPPGAIGARQLLRGGPVPGYFQPVEIKAPPGTLISLAGSGRFEEPTPAPGNYGLLIGAVYRVRVTNIPDQPGLEVFPTIEMIDRTYAPSGQERRFAIPIELSQEDLQLALAGKFVTRVIYLEDPQNAAPARSTPEQDWFDIGPSRDPLAVADALGRPVAILRLGGRVPTETEIVSSEFLFGSPPWLKFPPVVMPAPTRPVPRADATPRPTPQRPSL